MGLWGVLWEIFKVVVPHTAPHVARAVAGRKPVDIGQQREQIAAKEMADGLRTMEERVCAAEEKAAAAEHASAIATERAAAAEEKLALAEARFAGQWTLARKWIIGLLAWNALITALMIYLLVARR